MSKREKIILAITLLVGLYGFYSFIGTAAVKNKPKDAAKAVNDLTGFMTDITQTITGQTNTESDDYILKLASDEWQRMPFVEPDSTSASSATAPGRTDSETAAAVTFVYSGYLALGKKQLAIIDGIEYEVGEQLAKTDYVVQQITPRQVMVKSADGKNGITLTLDEINMD
ncbi:MAG: hypothetical protein PHY78_13200 [Desulfobacterales bacterium]|nr:hypothetical protein [Desulfobacterales bacterium]MDD4392848.1 hypothetical protein [Desulfobacterales bacterium]